MYHPTRIQIQVHHIIICNSHLTLQAMSIINEEYVLKRTIINAIVKRVLMNQSKSVQSLHPSYLHTCINQRPVGSNWIRIHYSAGFISYPSWIHLILYYHYYPKYTCCLWTIHPEDEKNYHIVLKRPHRTFCMHIYMHIVKD